jgi:hypothetical protein
MTDQDRDQFARLLHHVADMFREPLTDAQIAWYYQALQRWTFEEVAQACRAWTERETWFPKLAQLRAELEGGTPEDYAVGSAIALENAIVTVGYMQSLYVEDPHWCGALRDTFGGWPEACDDHAALDPPMWEARRKHFVEAYRLRSKRRPEGGRWQLLRGKADRDNATSVGTWRWEPERLARWLERGAEIGVLYDDGSVAMVRVRYRAVGDPDLADAQRQLGAGSRPALPGGAR